MWLLILDYTVKVAYQTETFKRETYPLPQPCLFNIMLVTTLPLTVHVHLEKQCIIIADIATGSTKYPMQPFFSIM